ncbi:hypothetical protein FY034_18600 (plasmid) [Trichlorobacter lovleyi]|uniref:hypothetical protein n=1 Tax=Trichlorobacter lovleyi TaxID=313985 RepID=UPI00223FAC75|nr:hypothetical protein [Trichlorobacter lovleyi]QOX80998.1 hypothetical protein FY034_18600 [Trichlorobacter lovleyi]
MLVLLSTVSGVQAEAPPWKEIAADSMKELASETITQETYTRLVTGAVVVQKRPTPAHLTGVHVAGFGIVHATTDKTWKGITECANLPKFMPSMVDCHEIKATRPLSSNEKWTYNELKFSFGPISKTIKIIEDVKWYPQKKNSWERVSGDTKVNVGSWRIIKLNDAYQLLVYDTVTDVEGVPDWVSRALTGSNLPATVTAMRNWIEGVQVR